MHTINTETNMTKVLNDDSVRSTKTVSIFDCSGHSEAISPSSSVENGYISCKSCLKIKTQRDSLSRTVKTNSSGSEHMSTILEVTDSSSCASGTKMKLKFDKIEMREYERILCDNPSTAGPPIGIGWRHYPEATVVVDLDSYESCREGTKRHKSELAIPPDVRKDMLRDAGFSRQEIADAVRRARKDKERRALSIQNQKYDPITEKVDTMKHCVKRIVSRKKKDSHLIEIQ